MRSRFCRNTYLLICRPFGSAVMLVFLMTILSSESMAQNYYQEYPISLSLATNGNAQRLECSVVDPVLQDTIYFQTDWINKTILVTGNDFGKIGYTRWNNPAQQDPVVGMITYDPLSHQFVHKTILTDIGTNEFATVVCGRIWFTVGTESYSWSNQIYWQHYTHYRYNPVFRNWGEGRTLWATAASTIWNTTPIGNKEFIWDEWDREEIFMYDPVSDINHQFSACVGLSNIPQQKDDYTVLRINCGQEDQPVVYDAGINEVGVYPPSNLKARLFNGIFLANDLNDSTKRFFIIYDQSQHQWKADSSHSPFASAMILKQGVITWSDSIPGSSRKVISAVYDPQLHNWVKDSTDVSGAISGLTITDGSVTWSDANGVHIRGYQVGTGWGNINTVKHIYFQLTDFSQQGLPVIHVRNYSIGTDSLYYDFGDGSTSLNNRHVFWRMYSDSGTCNVCLYDAEGTGSYCEPVTINLCSFAGNITAGADTVCEGENLELVLDDYSGMIQWQQKTDSVWMDIPSANSDTLSFSPVMPASYRAIVTSGNCLPSFSNEIRVHVHRYPGAPVLSDTLVYKCSSGSLRLSVACENVTFQWQLNNGGAWSNVPVNGTNNYYNVPAITATTQYRVVLKSGYCFTDTTTTIVVEPSPQPIQPVTTSGTCCGTDPATLTASGPGIMHWYRSGADSIVGIGNVLNPVVSTTTTFTVKASPSPFSSAGYSDNNIGVIDNSGGQGKGLRLFVDQPAMLEYMYVYPLQSGNLIISITNAATGYQVGSVYKPVVSGAGPVKIWFNSYLNGNTVYDIKLNQNSVPVAVNSTGMSYPMASSDGNVTVLGYVDSVFHDTPDFYNFYGMAFSSGCKSASASATASVQAAFNIAYITPMGPTSFCQGGSVTLSAFSGNFGYQWFRNGTLVANSGSSYMATTAGDYQLVMSNAWCFDTSSVLQVTVPCVPRGSHQQKNSDGEPGASVYYDQAAQQILWTNTESISAAVVLSLSDLTGRIIVAPMQFIIRESEIIQMNTPPLSPGIYLLNVAGNNFRQTDKIIIQ